MAALNTPIRLCLASCALFATQAEAQEEATQEQVSKLPAGIEWHTDPVAARRAAIEAKKPLLACSEFEGSRRFAAWKQTILDHRDFGKLVDAFVWLHVDDEILLWATDRNRPREGIQARAQRRFKARFGVMWEATFLVIDPFEFQQATWLPFEPNAEEEAMEAWLDARRMRLRTGMDPDFETYVENETIADMIETGGLYRKTEERVPFLRHDCHVVQYAALDALTRAGALPAARESLLGFLGSEKIALRQRAHDALLSEPHIADLHLEEFLHERLRYTKKEGPRNRWRLFAARLIGKYGDDRSIERLGKMSRESVDLYHNAFDSIPSLIELGRRNPKWSRRVINELKKSFPPAELDPEITSRASPEFIDINEKKRYRLAQILNTGLVELTGKKHSFPATYDAESAKSVIRFWNK